MSGVLLKKKKKILTKQVFTPRVWRTIWRSFSARRRHKKIKGGLAKNPNILKIKSSVSPHKKYKSFKKRLRSNQIVSSNREMGSHTNYVLQFKATRACILNFATLIGISKKCGALGGKALFNFNKYPTTLLTRKSTGHRMGKGKGKFSARIAKFKTNELILPMAYFDKKLFDNNYKAIVKSIPVTANVETVKNKKVFDFLMSSFDNVSNFKRVISKKRLYPKSKGRGR